jgi:hypothetical protein
MNQVPAVGKEQVDGFAKVWTHNGLAAVIDDVHKQFAVDFANIVLKNFIFQCMAEQAKKAAQAAPTLVVE